MKNKLKNSNQPSGNLLKLTVAAKSLFCQDLSRFKITEDL
jgi:hypothetical protein